VLNTKALSDTSAQLRTGLIQALTVAGVITAISGLLVQVSVNGFSPRSVMIIALYFVLVVAVFWLVQRQRTTIASTLIICVFTLSTLFTQPSIALLLGTLALIAVATLGHWSLYAIANVVIFGKFAAAFLAVAQANNWVYSDAGIQIAMQISALVVVTVFTRFFATAMQRSAEQTRRSNELLRATALVGQDVSRVLDLNELLTSAVNTIRERFNFYHVQVFLVDEKTDQATLVASTGEAGQRLLERKHQLAVGSRSVIGQVTARGEPIMAHNTENDPVHSRNELLPDTRSELALPISDGDRILGALDVQSSRANAFQNEDIQALQVMTNLLATAIRNARLFEAQIRSVEENQRLFIETEANLREIQRLNRQLTHSAWTDFLHGGNITTGITLESNRIVDDLAWTDRLTQATQTRQPVTGGGIIAVPVVLRGEVIGAIEVSADEDMPGSDTLEVVQAVADRLAISLDNARLFEEAQEATVQEQRINAIVAQLQSVSSVDDLLRVTLTELSQSLGAAHGAIRLGGPPDEAAIPAETAHSPQNGNARASGNGNGSAAS